MYFRIADKGITNGRVEAASEARERVWRQWKAYCKNYGVCPYLDGEDFQAIARISTGFGALVRCGKRGAPISAEMVRAGLDGVNTTIALDTGRQPLHQADGKHYIKPIQLMLAGFRNFDPGVYVEEACSPSRFAAGGCRVGHKSEVQREATRRGRSGQRDILLLATSGREQHEDEKEREEEEE